MPISESYYTDNLVLMNQFPDGFFDLAACDVNYGIGEARRAARRSRPVLQRNGSRTRLAAVHAPADWDDSPPPAEYFDELFRVARKIIIFGENYLDFSQKSSSSGRIFWDKCNGRSAFSDGELFWTNMFTGVRMIRYLWNGFSQGVSLQEPDRQRGNKRLNEPRCQPGQKPLALYYALYREFAAPGDRLLDTHSGSQTSRCVAHDLGLDWWGAENNAANFRRGERRFREHTSQLQLGF